MRKSIIVIIVVLFSFLSVNTLFATPDTWTQKTDFGGTARQNAVGFSIGSKGYMGTGNWQKTFWEYDPATNSWTQKTDFGGLGRSYAAGFSIGSKGYIGMGENASYYKDLWEYDPVGNTWTQKANLLAGGTFVLWGPAGFSIGSKGYIGTGWYTNSSYTKDFWEYDPVANTWTQKAAFGGTARQDAVGFSIGGKGYIGTGYDGTGYGSKDFWEYDPVGNTWTKKADFGGAGRRNAVGFSSGGKGYIGTGYDGSYRNDFWEYDQAANTWTQKTDFGGTGRRDAAGFSIGNKGYIGTGYNGSSVFKDFWEYECITDTTPDPFTFTDQINAALSTVTTSNTITIYGINAATTISITGGQYAINGGGYTSDPGTVSNGNTVTVQQTSSADYSTQTDATLTIGGASDTFSVTTLDDTTPDAFSFTDQTGVALSTVITSNTITVGGITAATSISITGGQYAINGGPYTSASGTVNNGNTVTVQQTSSGSYSTTTNTTLIIDGVADTFSVTTAAPPDISPPTPNPMTWTTPPSAAGATSISMVATTATDAGSPPVSYYVTFVSGGTGGTDSGWQSSTSYTNGGLEPNQQYGYQVKARDAAPALNETAWSSTLYAYTLANAPVASAFSNITETSIRANWTANGNPSGTQYYCENTTQGTNSGWTTNTSWASSGLTCNTSYSFRAKAKNGDGVETGWSDLESQATQACSGVLSITPADGLSSSGAEGGVFAPASKDYTLTNTGGVSIDWIASKNQGWVTLSATSGTLAAGASTTVSVSINSNANSLSAAAYYDTVTFTNTTNGTGNTTRGVALTINSPTQPRVLYITTSQNPLIMDVLADNGLDVSIGTAIPADMSAYALVIVSAYGPCSVKTANYLKKYAANGGGVLLTDGTPAYLASASSGGSTNDLSAIVAWFGASTYGDVGASTAHISYNHPFGTNLLQGTAVGLSTSLAAMVTGLSDESDTIAIWDYGDNNIFSFTHPYGNGRMYYTAQQPYDAAGTALFDGAIKWLIRADAHAYEVISHCVNDAEGLQAALTAAESNDKDDIIMVIQGTYTGNFAYTSSEGKNITLEGGYTSGCASRAEDPAFTVLDGGGAGRVLALYDGNGGNIQVEDFTIQNGSSTDAGGGIYASTYSEASIAGDIFVAGNIIIENTASNDGGGIFAHSSSNSGTAGTITFSTNIITGNSAGIGGGIWAYSASGSVAGVISIRNNTITNNSADSGGGFYKQCGNVGCYNNIIWGNTANTGADINLFGLGDANGYNNDYSVLYGSWTNSGGNINAPPLFVGGGNYHLLPTSPCIDMGLNSAPGIPVNDFEGDARIIDGNNDGTAFVDMGADEYGSVIAAGTSSNGGIFAGCSLISKYQPAFPWTFSEPFKSFTIYFSTSDTDFVTKGVLITKASITGTKSSYIPSAGVWKKIFTASWNSGNIRPIYWKVVGKRADKSLEESGIRSFSIDDPYYPEIQSPAEGAQLPAATPQTFVFDTNCNIKFRLEISSVGDFSDPKKIKAFSYSVKDPNVLPTLVKTLSLSQWKSVQKLIGTSTGYFRIIGWDAIKRESVSETRSFTILY